MNKEWKDKWTTALRSGDYAQGYNYLKLTDTKSEKSCFCVLGVLCDLWLKVKKKVQWTELPSQKQEKEHGLTAFGLHDKSILPFMLCEETGLLGEFGTYYQNPNVRIPNPDEEEDPLVGLVEANDDFMLTFGQLADLIEEQL